MSIVDLSRNNIPEIIVQLSKDKSPVNYVFSWNGSKLVNTLVPADNIIGTLDSNNNKASKLPSLSPSKGDGSTKSSLFLGDNIKDTTFSEIKVLELFAIQGFIGVIRAPCKLSEALNISTSNIDSTELSTLWGLDKDNTRYPFQNGYFSDFKWDSNGDILGVNWILSFEPVKNTSMSSPVKKLLLYLSVEDDEYGSLKISSIKKT